MTERLSLSLHWELGGKESAGQAGGSGSIPGSGTIPWRRKWQPTPVSLPGGNPMDRGAWQATVHGVAKSRTRLNNFHAGIQGTYRAPELQPADT